MKQKNIPTQIQYYKDLLKTIKQPDSCSIFVGNQYLQITQLIDYLNYLKDENKDKRLESKGNNLHDNLNLEKKSKNLRTTILSSEKEQKQVVQLQEELDELNRKKEQAERNLKEKNIVHKFEVTKLQLSYLESLSEIQEIQKKSILLRKSFQINSQTHYGFELCSKRYAYPLPDPENEQAQQNTIKRINSLLKHVDLVDKYLIKLKAERQTLLDQLNITSEENKLNRFKNIDKFLLSQFIRLSGFDQLNNGKTLSQIESFISNLIAGILNRSHLYEIDGFNPLDPIIEQGLNKILMKLEDHSDLSKALSEINEEYSDEGHISQVTIFEIGKEPQNLSGKSDVELHNERKLFLFKQDDLYFILKHDQTIKLIDNENLHLKLNINKILSDLSNETDLLKDLCERRIKHTYKKNLHTSNELTQVYQNEIEQLTQIDSIKEFNAIFLQHTNPTLFYFLSNVDKDLDRLALKLNKYDSEFEEISNFSLIKIKDYYKAAIVRVLLCEQEKRRQIRLEKITKNENEEIHLTNLIQQDEEREKQLLEQLNKKREEIFQVESQLVEILGLLNQSEKTYKKQIEDLENERKNLSAKLEKLNEKLEKLNKNMFDNEEEIRSTKQKIDDIRIRLTGIEQNLRNTQQELDKIIEEKKRLSKEKINLETQHKLIVNERKNQEKELKEKENEINQNKAWTKFLQNLNKALLDERINDNRQTILDKIETAKDLSELYNTLQKDKNLRKTLFEDLNEADVNAYINNRDNVSRDEKSNLHIKIKQLAKSFLGPLSGDLVSELGLNIKGDSIPVEKYKISTSGNVSYREIQRNLKDIIEREMKCQTGCLYFDKEFLKVSTNGIISLNDLPQKIQSLVRDRIKIKYQQHEWNNRLNKKDNEAVNQLNELKINYKQIVCCYVDQIEILCGGTFLLDTSEYYPGIDLIVRARGMKCGDKGKHVKLITTGSDAPEFEFKQTSDGSKKRDYADVSGGHSGYDGEFGRDGQHAGNIFIKIDKEIENLELVESIELSGGKGGDGQLGGNGDKGRKGKDGENGKAEDTRGFGGGQTTFGLGQVGTKSGDGGSAGFSGRGGKGGKPGKINISDSQGNRIEQIKDRVQQKEGSSGIDPDLSSDTAPKGGDGGEPTIIGMDQVRNKRSIFHKTETENGEIDIPYLLEKNPELRKKIEESSTFGNRGLPTSATVTFVLLNPVVLAPLLLLINNNITYRMSKNEDQYKLNPRRDKNTKGKSKENERSRFRQETEKESQIIPRDFTNTSNLDRSLSDKSKESSELIGDNPYEQRIDQLNAEKQDFENNIAVSKTQEEQLEIEIKSNEQTIAQLETEINQHQAKLKELRTKGLELNQEQSLKIGEELNLMTQQQELRDKRNEEALSQKITITNLAAYSDLRRQYQEEYNQMKDSLNNYKKAKELLLKKKKEEKAKIEDELAKVMNNLRENRKKLNRFKDEKLKLLKDETILSEDILHKTQQEVQHEHEITCLLDRDIDINIQRKRKTILTKIEKVAFTPFVRKLTNNAQNFPSFQQFNSQLHSEANDQTLEENIWSVITSDINKITQNNQSNSRKTGHYSKIDEFNLYPLLIESLKQMVDILKNISQIELNDIKFDLNQIERFYRGIHYSCEIDMDQINEHLRKINIDNENFELNKVFDDFMKQFQLITIEKCLDGLEEETRNNLLTNLKLVLYYLDNKNEELMFSYLNNNFCEQLSDLRKKLGDFNNTLLINIENGLKNIKERRFLQEINIIDDVEQVITLFDLRRLFRLECSSIDFHHNNSSLTSLELKMLEFNDEPKFEKLISLVNTFQETLKQKKDYFYGRSARSDRTFFEVIIHNFDHFVQDTIELDLLEKFENVINTFPIPLPSLAETRSEILTKFLAEMHGKFLTKIKRKIQVNKLITFLKQKNLLSNNCENIVEKLLSLDVHLDEVKRKSIEEKINQNEENNIELAYNELLSLISPEKAEVETEQVDKELNERNEDIKFIEQIKEFIHNANLQNTSSSSIKELVERILLQVFCEIYDTYNDKSIQLEAIEDYKKQVKYILKSCDNQNLEKCLFLFQALCQQSYFDVGLVNEGVPEEIDLPEIKNILFKLDYSYHNRRYDFENNPKSLTRENYIDILKTVKDLLERIKNHCLYNRKQIYLRLYNNLNDSLFRLNLEKILTGNDISMQIDLYRKDNNLSEDQIAKILSEILTDLTDNFSKTIKDDEFLAKFFGDICVKNFKLFRCLLNSCSFQISPDAFKIIRSLKKRLNDHKCSNDFHEILLSKYLQVCEYNSASVVRSLHDLSEKLDKFDDFKNAVHRVLTVLNNNFGIDTTEFEFYSKLKSLIDEVQSHYEKQSQFADKFRTAKSNESNCKHIDELSPTHTDIGKVERIRFSYKGEEKLFEFSSEHRTNIRDWLIYLRFVHKSTTTDEVLEKMKINYIKQIDSLRKEIVDKQLKEFLTKHNEKGNSDTQTKFLSLITRQNDNKLLPELFYYLKTSIKFNFEHEKQLSETISRLNNKDQFDELIIILQECEMTLFVDLIESLYKPFFEKRTSCELNLSNKKKNIIHQYELLSQSQNKQYQKLQNKFIELCLEKTDNIFNEDNNDIFYQKRIETFDRLTEEIKKKKNTEEIEQIIGAHLNQQVFDKFKSKVFFQDNIIDSNRSVKIPDSRVKPKTFNQKKLDYFFEENGRFSMELAKELKQYYVQVNLNNQEKIYNFSWNDWDQFDEIYPMLNHLYASHRIEVFQKAIRNFQSNITRENLIEIIKHLAYLFRSDGLIALKSESQINTIIQFINDFHSIIVDAIFPNIEDQFIISDFLDALNSFDFGKEIEDLKACLRYKIYKERNYVLVEKEYEELIEKRKANPITICFKSSVTMVTNILHLMNLLKYTYKFNFFEECKTNFSEVDKLDGSPFEIMLKKKREELLQPESTDSSVENIDLTQINKSIDMNYESIQATRKNLIILKVRLIEHFAKLKDEQIKHLFNSMTKIEQDNEYLSDLKYLLIHYYVIKIKSKIEQENHVNNEFIRLAVSLSNKLFQLLKNRKGYEELLDHVDKIWSCIEDKEQLNSLLYDIIDKNFHIDPKNINKNNLTDILHTFNIVPLDYLNRKNGFFKELCDTKINLNNNANENCLITNLIRYFLLFRLSNENEDDILVKCFEEIIAKTLDSSLCDKQFDVDKDKKEILLVEDNENFYILYSENDQSYITIVDDEQNVAVRSSLCFDRNEISCEIFEQNCKLVYEMIRMKGGKISINFDKNQVIKDVKKLLGKGLSIDANQPFCNDEEKQQIQWILSFAKETNQKVELDKIFSKPVLSWLEELNALKIKLVTRKILEQISNNDKEIEGRFHDSIKLSQFFAKDNINDWFEILVQISRSNLTNISLTDLTKIISLFSDFRDLSIVKKLLANTNSHSWLFNILCMRIESSLKIMLKENLGDDLENKLSHLKGKLRLSMDPKCFFLDIFGQLILEYENSESKLLETNFKGFLIEFIDLVLESRVDLDESLLNKLSLKPLSLWKFSLEKKILFKNLEKYYLFKNAIEIDQSITVDYLYRIREEKGNEILENLLDLIGKISNNKCTLNKLNELLEELTFGGFTLDKGSLKQLKGKPFEQWQECLKNYTEQQHYELDIDQLIETMKEKVGKGKVNESIQHLLNDQLNKTEKTYLFERIYSFYGKEFNQKENKSQIQKRYSTICTSLSNKSIKDWEKVDIRQWADTLKQEKRSSKKYFDWNKDYLPEIMAVIIRAVEIYHGYYPRNIQLIALAIFLEPNSSAKGRLGNISTGEGKSLITAMLAVSHALIGDKVDIVTSSKVLAIRDASNDPDEGYQKFYFLFGLNVSNNCDDQCENPKTGQALRKERYQVNEIIYGETGYFQRDILLTKFFGKDIRDRIGDILIVDEVDNMFIDNAEKILYISHSIADMRHLRDLFIHIWVSVNNKIEQTYSEENIEKIHKYIKLMIKNKDLKIPRTLTKFIDINLKTWILNAYIAKYIESNDNYIIGDMESNKHGEILIMDKDTGVEQLNTRWSNGLHQFLQLKHCGKLSDESLKAVFISNMNFFKLYDSLNGMSGTIGDHEERKLLSLEYGTDCFELPRFRKYRFQYEKRNEFVGRNEHEWFEKILEDIREKMKANRKINESEKNEIEKMKQESESLLRIVNNELEKLKKELNDETNKHDELSKNINEIEVNKKNLIEKIQNSSVSDDKNKSKKNYDELENFEIKINEKRKAIDKINQKTNSLNEAITFHEIQRAKLEKTFQDSEQILTSGDKRDSRRAVLIICENIAHLEKIAEKVRQEFQTMNNIYTYDRAYRKFEKNLLTPGDIIIATNIAGRGTDLAIDKLLDANGGLHVILSYIPGNLRVQQQAFGRTARAGKRGTGTYIVYDSRKMTLISHMTVDFLLDERNEKEKERLEEIVRKSFPKIKLENILFEEFNLFKEEIKLKIQESFSKTENQFYSDLNFLPKKIGFKLDRAFLLNNNDPDFNTNYLDLQLNSLQNHWAFWLNEMDEKLSKVYAIGGELILKKLNEFKERILREFDSNIYCLITEPAELIKLGKLFMDKKKYSEAQDCYNQIIKDHPEFSEIAHYYNAFCIIHLGGGDTDAKAKAKVNLKKALNLLESKRNTIMSRHQILLSLNHITQKKGQGLNVNYFKKQNDGEAQILSYHINAILEAIGSEISSEHFRNGTITGDHPTEIYKEILKDDYDLIKDTRISKKIIIGSKVLIESTDEKWTQISNENITLNKDDLLTYEKCLKLGFNEIRYRELRGKLQKLGIVSHHELYRKFNNNTNPECITFPNTFKYCQEKVLNSLESLLIKSQQQNWTFKKRIINENFFETLVFHKDMLLTATQGIVKPKEMIRITENIRDNLVGKLDEPVFCGLGDHIKDLLLGKKSVSLSAGDRINRNTFVKVIGEKLNVNDKEKSELNALISSAFEEKIQIGSQVSETLKQNIDQTIFAEKTLEIQEAIQNSLSGNDEFPLSVGDIIKKTTLIDILKQFPHEPKMTDEQIANILKYLEFNERVRINENLDAKFDENTNDEIFCEKKGKIKRFFLGEDSYTLTSGEKVCLKSDKSVVSKSQLIEIMKEIGIKDEKKIHEIFMHLALEFHVDKFIHSYTEFYLDDKDIQQIKNYLSKTSLIITNENKEEIKSKIEMLSFVSIGSLNNKSKVIKKTLLKAIEDKNYDFTKENFGLSQEEFELLRAVLQDNGVVEPTLYKLLCESHENNSFDSYKEFYANLESILITLYYNDGRISEENLVLRSANEVSKELFYHLRESNVIKGAKVYFKFTCDPKKRIEDIRKRVEVVVGKVFNLIRKDDLTYDIADQTGFGDFVKSENNELDKFIDSITNVLKQCAGVFRTLPKIKISEKNLKTMFQTGQIPPEIMDYVMMCFDSVLSLTEAKGLWDWNAFCCAMIGTAQIVAGVALEICSCGAAHYFAQVLISEGIGDIVFAIQSMIQRNFSWKAYSQHKVQSLIISLLTAGVGSYLSGGAHVGKTTIALATYTAVLKAIGKETMTHLITGVASTIVSVKTDELSQFVMKELVEKHFEKILDEWIANNAIYKSKKMALDERMQNIYKKFGVEDAKNIINESIQATLVDLQHGDLTNAIFNKVTQIAHGISGAFSSTARILQKKPSKAALFGLIAKVIDKSVTRLRIINNLKDLCSICQRFCEILEKKLLDSFNNKSVKSNSEKIKEENASISISANISDHVKSMEEQMKTAMKEKVRNDFLKPGIQFTLNHAMRPITEFLTFPFANAREELEEHIDERAKEFVALIDKKGQESLNTLTSRKIRALEQLRRLINIKDIDSEDLDICVSNLDGQSIRELKAQYGDNVRIAIINGKVIALIPTYQEYMHNVEHGVYAGSLHLRLAAEKYDAPIEILDPENDFQPHAKAPNDGLINPSKNSNKKTMKVAYIKNKDNDKIGHFAPVIEVDGKLQVVDISQNVDTNDQCFAQTMLFLEGYKEGKITNIDFNSAHDYGIDGTHIKKFNKDLAQFGRGSSLLKYDYHEGVTVENSQFLGGARKPLKDRIPTNLYVGRYGQLCYQWEGRGGLYEINHVPAIAVYKGTLYENIKMIDMPTIVMHKEDHRSMISTGSSNVSKQYRLRCRKYLQDGDMYNAIKLELIHTLTVNKKISYEQSVHEYIEYVAKTPVKGAPPNSKGTITLLTQVQANNLIRELLVEKNLDTSTGQDTQQLRQSSRRKKPLKHLIEEI